MERKLALIALSMILAVGMIPLSSYGVDQKPQGIEADASIRGEDPLPPVGPPPEGMPGPSDEEIMLKRQKIAEWLSTHAGLATGWPPCDFNEIEPNNLPPATQLVTYGDTVCADCTPDASDWDFYLFTGTAGQYITVDVEAMTYGGDFDPQVYITDEILTTLAFNEDWGGPPGPWIYDSRIANFALPYTGNYYILVKSVYPGALNTNYNLILYGPDPIDLAEPNDVFANATHIPLPPSGSPFGAGISPLGDLDFYYSFAYPTQHMIFTVTPAPGLKPGIAIYDEIGTLLDYANGGAPGEEIELQIDWGALGYEGHFFMKVVGSGNTTTGLYTLAVDYKCVTDCYSLADDYPWYLDNYVYDLGLYAGVGTDFYVAGYNIGTPVMSSITIPM
ncbi:hypothetical protein AMJ40_04645, partial [candidate division TA06 bacterium DG_26]